MLMLKILMLFISIIGCHRSQLVASLLRIHPTPMVCDSYGLTSICVGCRLFCNYASQIVPSRRPDCGLAILLPSAEGPHAHVLPTPFVLGCCGRFPSTPSVFVLPAWCHHSSGVSSTVAGVTVGVHPSFCFSGWLSSLMPKLLLLRALPIWSRLSTSSSSDRQTQRSCCYCSLRLVHRRARPPPCFWNWNPPIPRYPNPKGEIPAASRAHLYTPRMHPPAPPTTDNPNNSNSNSRPARHGRLRRPSRPRSVLPLQPPRGPRHPLVVGRRRRLREAPIFCQGRLRCPTCLFERLLPPPRHVGAGDSGGSSGWDTGHVFDERAGPCEAAPGELPRDRVGQRRDCGRQNIRRHRIRHVAVGVRSAVAAAVPDGWEEASLCIQCVLRESPLRTHDDDIASL